MKKKTKRIKLTPLPKLIKQTHDLVSKYVRARDKQCVLCGSRENLCAGHLFKRGKKIITFDLRNVNCLCKPCNWQDNFFHDKYVDWFIRKYGVALYHEFMQTIIDNPTFKFKREELHSLQISLKYLIEEKTDYKEGIESIQRDAIEVGIKEYHKKLKEK